MRRGGLPQAALCTLLAALLVLAPRSSFALGPFEKNHPRVEEGQQAYDQGRFDDALTAFEAAQRELPDNPVVEYDRGNALFKLKRLEEAREAYHRVAELDRGQLQEKDYYNLGNALAELNQPKDAIAAYRKALLLDPTDDLARHNMEVVLRDLPRPKKPPPQPQPDGGSDAGQDAGRDGGGGGRDGGQQDGGSGDGGTGDGGTMRADGGTGAGPGDGGSDGGAGGARQQPQPPQPQDGGSGQPDDDSDDQGGRDAGEDQQPMRELNKKDVERLLDSMKQSEKNLQLWRFQQRKGKARKDNGKDW